MMSNRCRCRVERTRKSASASQLSKSRKQLKLARRRHHSLRLQHPHRLTSLKPILLISVRLGYSLRCRTLHIPQCHHGPQKPTVLQTSLQYPLEPVCTRTPLPKKYEEIIHYGKKCTSSNWKLELFGSRSKVGGIFACLTGFGEMVGSATTQIPGGI